LWFDELQPLPESIERTGVWPFTGNPKEWIDKSDPNYTPSIYADTPMIDVTGSGVINSITGSAKGGMGIIKGLIIRQEGKSALKGRVPKMSKIKATPKNIELRGELQKPKITKQTSKSPMGGIVAELNKTAKEYNLKDLKLKDNITELPKPLESVIDNEKLFNNYPTLKNIKISYKNLGEIEGALSTDLKNIYISPELPIKDQVKKIKHEIVHAIQGEKGTLPTSLYKGINKDFIDYLSDPSEVLARSIESGEEIPEIFNEVFRLRGQHIKGEGKEIEPLELKGIKKVGSVKILPRGKDVYIPGWQQRRLLNELRPDDPKPVRVEGEALRLDFGKGNGIIAADLLNESGLGGVTSLAPFTADIPITDKNILKLKELFQNYTDKKLLLPKPSNPLDDLDNLIKEADEHIKTFNNKRRRPD